MAPYPKGGGGGGGGGGRGGKSGGKSGGGTSIPGWESFTSGERFGIMLGIIIASFIGAVILLITCMVLQVMYKEYKDKKRNRKRLEGIQMTPQIQAEPLSIMEPVPENPIISEPPNYYYQHTPFSSIAPVPPAFYPPGQYSSH